MGEVCAWLVLGSEQSGVGLDEGVNLRHCANQALKLGAIQRDGEAAEAVDRYRATGACAIGLGCGDLEGDGLGLIGDGEQGLHVRKLLLQGFVLLGEVREDGHWHSSVAA